MAQFITSDGTRFEYGDSAADKVIISTNAGNDEIKIPSSRVDKVLDGISDPNSLSVSQWGGLNEFASLENLRQFATRYLADRKPVNEEVILLIQSINELPIKATLNDVETLIASYKALKEKPDREEQSKIQEATKLKMSDLVRCDNFIPASKLKFSPLNK